MEVSYNPQNFWDNLSVDVGLSDDAKRQMLEKSLANEHWRFFFERELFKAFSDNTTSWSELLFNDIYEVRTSNGRRAGRSCDRWAHMAAGVADEPPRTPSG